MAENHLTRFVKITEAVTEAAGAAGVSDITGATLDMAGFDSVAMMVVFGAITGTAVTSIKAQQGAAADLSDAADLEGTAQTVADTDDGKTFIINLIRPRERYVRVIVDRGTANAVVRAAFYIQHAAKEIPVTAHGSTVVTPEYFVDVVEGTA